MVKAELGPFHGRKMKSLFSGRKNKKRRGEEDRISKKRRHLETKKELYKWKKSNLECPT